MSASDAYTKAQLDELVEYMSANQPEVLERATSGQTFAGYTKEEISLFAKFIREHHPRTYANIRFEAERGGL